MIVPMKKVSLVVLDSERERSLEKLRELGVLHLQVREGHSETLAGLQEDLAALQRALVLLPQVKAGERDGDGPEGDVNVERSLDVARRAQELADRERGMREDLSRLERTRSFLAEWGDFDPRDIEMLAERGIIVRLFTMTKEELEAASEASAVFAVREQKNVILAAVVDRGETSTVDGVEVQVPDRGLSEVEAAIDETVDRLEEVRRRMGSLALERGRLEESARILESRLEFERARVGMEVDGALAYLTGFAPVPVLDRLEQSAHREGWATLVEEPAEEDPVPTLVRNPGWIRIIKPVFDFLGTVPGYREYDISFWFLLFLSVFFAMIIGDAGYGLIFLLLTVLGRIKWRRAPAEPFFLMFVFSACTVAWGAATGTWFGIESLARDGSPFARFIVDPIASFPEGGGDSSRVVMKICFVLGAVHLTIAHFRNFIRDLPRLRSLSELGWLTIVWGMFLLIQIVVLRRDAAAPLLAVDGWPALVMPPGVLDAVSDVSLIEGGIVLVAAGLALVALFAEQEGRFFRGVGLGFARLPMKALDTISAFSDVVSYIRLFAVGLATVKVAESFNQMAAEVGFGLPAGLAAALILFLGHSLNIVMGALSIVVHGVRLNILEFSSHLGMEWTGIPYRPFRQNDSPTDQITARST